MKITFLGATKIVTGSNFLVEAAGKKFLVDCGMYQGNAELEMKNYKEFDYNPAEIDFMLLTHAHIDHSGRIPKLYKEGYRKVSHLRRPVVRLAGIHLLCQEEAPHNNEIFWQGQHKSATKEIEA